MSASAATTPVKSLVEQISQNDIDAAWFGAEGLTLVDVKNLQQAQTGFSIDPFGRKLSGDNHGDWRENWYVIGFDFNGRYPLFADLDDPEFPVFTARRSAGLWLATRLSATLDKFFKSLKLLNYYSRQTAALSIPINKYRLSDDKLFEIYNGLNQINGEDADYYWSILIDRYRIWAEKS